MECAGVSTLTPETLPIVAERVALLGIFLMSPTKLQPETHNMTKLEIESRLRPWVGFQTNVDTLSTDEWIKRQLKLTFISSEKLQRFIDAQVELNRVEEREYDRELQLKKSEWKPGQILGGMFKQR